MKNVGEKTAWGASVFGESESEQGRVGLRARYRRWLGPRTSVELSPDRPARQRRVRRSRAHRAGRAESGRRDQRGRGGRDRSGSSGRFRRTCGGAHPVRHRPFVPRRRAWRFLRQRRGDDGARGHRPRVLGLDSFQLLARFRRGMSRHAVRPSAGGARPRSLKTIPLTPRSVARARIHPPSPECRVSAIAMASRNGSPPRQPWLREFWLRCVCGHVRALTVCVVQVKQPRESSGSKVRAQMTVRPAPAKRCSMRDYTLAHVSDAVLLRQARGSRFSGSRCDREPPGTHGGGGLSSAVPSEGTLVDVHLLRPGAASLGRRGVQAHPGGAGGAAVYLTVLRRCGREGSSGSGLHARTPPHGRERGGPGRSGHAPEEVGDRSIARAPLSGLGRAVGNDGHDPSHSSTCPGATSTQRPRGLALPT